MRLIYYFNTWAIIWHGIVPVFLKICTDLQEICSIWAQNCFCYCFWIILQVMLLKLSRNNNKYNFVLKCCKFLANSCKSSEILEQCHVKWWTKYWNNGSVSWSCIDQFKSVCQRRQQALRLVVLFCAKMALPYFPNKILYYSSLWIYISFSFSRRDSFFLSTNAFC